MKIDVLDHGYVELVEHWGSEESIIAAARMSTNKGFQGWGTPEKPGDEKLLRYLWNHKHYTPFEMAGTVIEVCAPILCFREWRTHRTIPQCADEWTTLEPLDDCFPGDSSFNELSARYAPLPNLNYIPSIERLTMTNDKNKQAGTVQGALEMTAETAWNYQRSLEREYKQQEHFYKWSLEMGVPKELARAPVGVGRYSRMRASANLRNWLSYCTLRMAEDAQFEIRMFANAVGQIIAEKFPRTWKLFCERGENNVRQK